MDHSTKDNSEEKVLDGKKVIESILLNYKGLEKSVTAQLNMTHHHGTTIGTLRETIWQEYFEQIIPKKFVIEQSVFIIDSNRNVSREVDLAIMDEMYTPYIFRFGKIKFVPIEAVAVAVECKSKSQDIASLKTWSDSIKNLETCSESIARIASTVLYTSPITQKSTRPIQILCRLNNNKLEGLKDCFDFIISEVDKKIDVHYEKDNLFDWFEALNFHKESYQSAILKNGLQKVQDNMEKLKEKKLSDYEIKENPLLSFNFQLNQLLMLINNPMPFPHLKYAKMFNESSKTCEKE